MAHTKTPRSGAAIRGSATMNVTGLGETGNSKPARLALE